MTVNYDGIYKRISDLSDRYLNLSVWGDESEYEQVKKRLLDVLTQTRGEKGGVSTGDMEFVEFVDYFLMSFNGSLGDTRVTNVVNLLGDKRFPLRDYVLLKTGIMASEGDTLTADDERVKILVKVIMDKRSHYVDSLLRALEHVSCKSHTPFSQIIADIRNGKKVI